MKLVKQICVLFLGAVMCTGLCGCAIETYVDQDFIDLNQSRNESSAVAVEPPAVSSEEPQDESSMSTAPSKKPHGLVLVEQSEPPVVSDASDEPDTSDASIETSEPTDPHKPSGGAIINGVKISAGLKAALNVIGKTSVTGIDITAFQPKMGTDGGITIFRIHNNNKSASQTMYTYYESPEDYETAKKGLSSSACYDALRLVTRSTTEILPVPNPETMGIVLFDGYILWR